MKTLNYTGILLCILLMSSCQKKEESVNVTFLVEDITTGNLQAPVGVILEEVEESQEVFGPVTIKTLDSRSVEVGQAEEFSFLAKSASRFTYRLRVDNFGLNFDSPFNSVDPMYETIDMIVLEKEGDQLCTLKIEPTANVGLKLVNEMSNGGQAEDSISVLMADGHIEWSKSIVGLGDTPDDKLAIPHGLYTIEAFRYRDGSLLEQRTENLSFSYQQDTVVLVQF